MAKTFNDISTRGWLKYDVTASGNDVLSGGARIMAILLSTGSDASSIIAYDAATQTGTDLIKLTATTNGVSPYVSFGPNGHVFDTGLSVTLAGTGALASVFYLET